MRFSDDAKARPRELKCRKKIIVSWLRICGPLHSHPPCAFMACNEDTFTIFTLPLLLLLLLLLSLTKVLIIVLHVNRNIWLQAYLNKIYTASRMHIMQETLRKYCRTACERSPGIDSKLRMRRGKWSQQPRSFLNAVGLAVHRGELESYLTLQSSERTVCHMVALNSLPLGLLKINLIRKFYTFLIIQINIILH